MPSEVGSLDDIERLFEGRAAERGLATRAEADPSPENDASAPPVRKKRRRRALIVAGVVLLVLLLLLGGAVGFLFSLLNGVTVVSDEKVFPDARTRPQSVVVGRSRETNILILGTDTRSGIVDDELLDGTATGQRSDTMILVNLSADGKSVAAISLMRDLWVDIPGRGQAKLNAALAWGGLPLVVQTIENLTHARIDHVAVVDFEGFADISTALGGVTVDSPIDFTSQNMAGYHFTKGANVVRGQAALAFVRERYAFATSDYQRVRNQRSFVAGAAQAMRDSAGGLNVNALIGAIRAAASHLSVDSGLSIPRVTELAQTAMGATETVGFTLPTRGTDSIDGQSVVLVDTTALEGIVAALADDSVVAFAQQHGLDDAKQ